MGELITLPSFLCHTFQSKYFVKLAVRVKSWVNHNIDQRRKKEDEGVTCPIKKAGGLECNAMSCSAIGFGIDSGK
ncbi:hypothetical protein Y032_0201g1731 [Ancylostoma ceylanicum]|uniref:Uncharacterized protein n=1 Tax=Ancylostoma ceylanicum TaxID=53326 RepID=A0A016SMH4_9BILA|nr:hypothetical protein Y032_0201g1731 [Ancylostoma ceylanicum]